MSMRFDWTAAQITAIFDRPLLELLVDAAQLHRQNFTKNSIQVAQLVSVKTGACPEDCAYCPQAARYNTGLKREPLMELAKVTALAKDAKKRGASRLCLGAAWREVRDDKGFERVLAMVEAVNAEGLEVCCTLGMLKPHQAERLKKAGLYAYNHNLDTSASHYKRVISTRSYEDRLATLATVRKARLSVCCGGILGLGESKADRIEFLRTLASLNPHPDSVPINTLVAVKGTPLAEQAQVPVWDLVRVIATARILMPQSYIRLSAGRKERSFQDQALCFLAGANSIFAGDKLLTTPNNDRSDDEKMLALLGLRPQAARSSFEPETQSSPTAACTKESALC